MFRTAILSAVIALAVAFTFQSVAQADAPKVEIGYSFSDKAGNALLTIDSAGKVIVPEGADVHETARKIAAIMNAKGLCGVKGADFPIHDKAGIPIFTVSHTGKMIVSPGVHTNQEARSVLAELNAKKMCSAQSVATTDEGIVTIHGVGKAKAQ